MIPFHEQQAGALRILAWIEATFPPELFEPVPG